MDIVGLVKHGLALGVFRGSGKGLGICTELACRFGNIYAEQEKCAKVTPLILYHYCGSQTGFAILNKRTLRLSALSGANDSLEGRILGEIFTELLAQTELSPEVAEVASVIVEGYPESTEGFAFCLSEQGDLLSQWRAYGRDGTGISIGFSSEKMDRDYGSVNFGSQFFELTKVDYGLEGLRERIAPLVEEITRRFTEVVR